MAHGDNPKDPEEASLDELLTGKVSYSPRDDLEGLSPEEISIAQHFADVVNYLSDIYDVLVDIRDELQREKE